MASSWTEAIERQTELLQGIFDQAQEQTALLKEQRELMREHKRAFAKFARDTDRQMEVVISGCNFLEWRSCLIAESKWSGLSLQASHKAWKLNCTAFPSRDGEDRRGGRGSPLEPEDERKGDEELPDERLIQRASAYSLAEYGTTEPGAQMMRAELAKQAATRSSIEAAQRLKLARETEQKATERMRQLRVLMRNRAEPEEPAAQPREQSEPVEDEPGEDEPGERAGAGAAAAADEPAAPPPPQEEPAGGDARSSWC